MDILLGLEERVKAFDARHGNDPVVYDGMFLFADGAQREKQALGLWLEPPVDGLELARLIHRYHARKLEFALEAFNELKFQLSQQAFAAVKHAGSFTAPHPPTRMDIADLKALQRTVLECRQRADQAKAELEDAKPPVARQQEAESLADLERGQAALAAIESIKV